MARIDKIVQKMKNRPNGVRLEEIMTVLNHNGYILVRTKGSHHHFRNEQRDLITLPRQNPLKAAYVRDVLKRIGK
ncbi:type II toxin-antitoxin system HicA family toxin [Paenibacillus larvae]